MSTINVTLKDGNVLQVPKGSTAYEVAGQISAGLARNALAAELNGKLVDLRYPLKEDCELAILTFDDEGGRHAFWHTSSHIMAQAVQRLYPGTKLAIGPPITEGFYYDFDRETPFSDDELRGIEKEMKNIIKENPEITRYVLPREEALDVERERGEKYKVELIQDLPEDEEISFYKQGEFSDLCAGPHVMDMKQIKAIRLTSVAGAYWRGSEKNDMLTRIYGITFPKKSLLDEYLERIEEAKKRDHRKLGRELKLFTFREEGPGFPFFLPNGMVLKNTLLKYWHEVHAREGYQEISTPIMLSRELWETSGHWDHYRENMYTTEIDEDDFAVKPMNCPGSLLVYNSDQHSYRDLPLRMAELGLVHRHEKSGVLHGLMRVRSFTQDDAHIYMMPEQIKNEIKNVVRLIDEVYTLFGFDYYIELSTRPEDSMGSDEEWESATEALKDALDELGLDYKINEGDGAFYGPKIDFHLIDALQREWQCGTIQLDFQLPQKFETEYIGADGDKHQPVMIHRVVLGSVERFLAVLIEHLAGKFPFWLAPVQVRVMSIGEDQIGYADAVTAALRRSGIRAETDVRNEKVGYKVREAQLDKIPYMLVLGGREAEEQTVSLRLRDEQKTVNYSLEDFVDKCVRENAQRTMELSF